MKTIEMKTGELVPYHANPRKNDAAVEAVANSIREFGFKQPIVVDSENVVIVGHTRLEAAKRLGLETVPVIVADDLDEEKARAYRLADNKTNELSEWDWGLLEAELAAIDGIEMSDFGFSADDVRIDVDAKLEEVEEDGYDPDEGGLRQGAAQATCGRSGIIASCAAIPRTRRRWLGSWAASRPTCC